MKYSIVVKFLVILLTALSLLSAIFCGSGIYAMESANLYANGIDSLQDQQYDTLARSIAKSYATIYAVETLGNLSYAMRQDLYTDPQARSDTDHWTVSLSLDGQTLVAPEPLNNCTFVKEFSVTPEYPIAVYPQDALPVYDDTQISDDLTEPTDPAFTVPTGYLYRRTESFWHDGQLDSYELYYYEAPEYTVTVYLCEQVLNNSSLNLLTALYPYRYAQIAGLAIGLILGAIGIVYLCWSSGRSRDGSIFPSGLSLLPADIHLALVAAGIYLLSLLYGSLERWISNEGLHPGSLSFLGLLLMGALLLCLSFLYTFSAQLKLPNRYVWRHSLLGLLLTGCFRGLRFLGLGIRKLCRMLSILWQWLLTALFMAVSVTVFLILADRFGSVFIPLLVLSILGCIALVCYGGYAFGILLNGVNIMARGDLSHQIPVKYLLGSFREFALQLNSLSGTARETAQLHLRSERMKTELITNVTHDIKTPLTSIINFVDLLQRDPGPEDTREYLHVLSRQSLQMKRLIDDLIELSKAASGSVSVHTVAMDAAETVNQALGEFSDKLEAAHLTPVFPAPETPITFLGDGRLVWRILSNILSNAVKYAMPDTRLYVALAQLEDTVLLSVKNVSRQPLNVSAEDLMERFVQGDTSRSTEGSGLGLNIAKTLMEVMGGSLQLCIDGDLFKVTLLFPAVSCS